MSDQIQRNMRTLLNSSTAYEVFYIGREILCVPLTKWNPVQALGVTILHRFPERGAPGGV